jgi:hypothetical protein
VEEQGSKVKMLKSKWKDLSYKPRGVDWAGKKKYNQDAADYGYCQGVGGYESDSWILEFKSFEGDLKDDG